MAREIHDTLAQGLAAISMRLELAKNVAAGDWTAIMRQVETAHRLTRETLAEVDPELVGRVAAYRAGYLPEERGLYKKMKVGEQAIFFARMRGLSKFEAIKRLRKWFDRMELTEWWDRKVEDLSKGMAQKVQFIVTVAHEPKLLIFDEPFSGFDPINTNLLQDEILNLRDRGATIIFSTHNMESVEALCDNITLINKSRNVLSGSVGEIRRRAGGNTFRVVFSGEYDKFTRAISDKAELIGEPENLIGGYTQHKLHIKLDEEIRPVIGALNESVNLRSFQEIIPSMNDIFIRAVNGTL